MSKELKKKVFSSYYNWFDDLIATIDNCLLGHVVRKDPTGTNDRFLRYYITTHDGREKFLIALRPVPTKVRINVCFGVLEDRIDLSAYPLEFGHKQYPTYPDINLPAGEKETMSIVIEIVRQVAAVLEGTDEESAPGTPQESEVEAQFSNVVARRVVFFRTGWMKYYRGKPSDRSDDIFNGGSFVGQNKYGHEIYNFLPLGNKYYGYVQPVASSIAIEKLGAGRKEPLVQNVLVVFVATPEFGKTQIVGWYRDAVVYRQKQEASGDSNRYYKGNACGYYAVADVERSTLLDFRSRPEINIPRGKGGFGQSNVWYAGMSPNQEFVRKVIALVDAHETIHEDEDHFQENVHAAKFQPMQLAPVEKGQPRTGSSGSYYQKNPKVSKSALQQSGYECAANKLHRSFTSRVSSMNYVEAHHLVPMEFQDEYRVGLDVIGNVVPLCPNCHKLVHHGCLKQREEVLSKLFELKRQDLLACGIVVDIESLLRMYDKEGD